MTKFKQRALAHEKALEELKKINIELNLNLYPCGYNHKGCLLWNDNDNDHCIDKGCVGYITPDGNIVINNL